MLGDAKAPEGESVQVVETASGRPVQLTMFGVLDDQVLSLDQCTLQAGPAASEEMRQRLS